MPRKPKKPRVFCFLCVEISKNLEDFWFLCKTQNNLEENHHSQHWFLIDIYIYIYIYIILCPEMTHCNALLVFTSHTARYSDCCAFSSLPAHVLHRETMGMGSKQQMQCSMQWHPSYGQSVGTGRAESSTFGGQCSHQCKSWISSSKSPEKSVETLSSRQLIHCVFTYYTECYDVLHAPALLGDGQGNPSSAQQRA